ncbi:efflux RND transporter periplasmic adaptor subunit [Sulfurimonas sp. HSL-1716]|uniref:efflux RND transporter periplasmic adaptor subunit n=1 Tax=Hydrocurvibacter sulfurireducens TaxID=3131937 RepID=UPI0031F91E11
MQEMQKVTTYKSKRYVWTLLLFLFILIIAFISYEIFTPKEEQNAYSYISEPLKKGDLVMTVSATGNIQPIEQVEVGSEVSGTIEKVFVDYNDAVKKGEILAELDKTKYQSALNKAEASLASAKSSLENTQAQLYQADSVITRDKLLKESTKGALPSRNDWDKDWSNYLVAKAQVSNAKAQVEQAKQVLISARYDLQRTTIYSPVNGIILVRNIDPGQTVAASFQTPVLFKIAKDLTKMELQASIDEADIAKVKAGQNATFRVDAYENKTFNAKVRLVRVNSEILEGVVTYKAIMNVDNSAMLLKPGMSADIDITTQTIKNVFIVPKAALLFIPVKPKVKKLNASRRFAKVTIDSKPHIWKKEGSEAKKIYVKVLGDSGSRVAIESDQLKEGDPVIVTQEKKK